jgi:hypothetical protein
MGVNPKTFRVAIFINISQLVARVCLIGREAQHMERLHFARTIVDRVEGLSMTLQDMMKAVEALSPEEMRQLREHIEQIEHESVRPKLDIAAIERVFADLREGFTEEEFGRTRMGDKC